MDKVESSARVQGKLGQKNGLQNPALAAVDFIPKTFPVLTKCRSFIQKAVVIDDTLIVNYTEYASVDVLPFEEKT